MTNSIKRILEKSILGGAAILALVAAMPSYAAKSTIGPFLDLKAEVTPQDQINGGTFLTSTEAWVLQNVYPPYNLLLNPLTLCPPPAFGCVHVYLTDYIGWVGSGHDETERVLGVSYITSDDAASRDTVRFTTVYGLDLQPDSTELAMTGFNRRAPELKFHSERVLGPEGNVYDANFSKFVPIANLGKVLGPGFDLSPFQGDPSSSVYVFRTTIPSSALVVSVP
jgi:hypothetical protein